MDSKIITCPNCRGKLEVTNPREDPMLLITCPNLACGAKLRVRFDTGETIIAPKKKMATVSGYLSYDGRYFPLQEGRNTVGRSSSKHEAQIELETTDRTMSRAQCLLEVVRTENGRVKVIISDMRSSDKISQKPTLVGDDPLEEGDRLVLEDGDTIQMGEQIIRFLQKELPK